jgi:hypothetical protein
MSTGILRARVLAAASCAAVVGLVTWATYDWTTALIASAAVLVWFTTLMLTRVPSRSRRSRWVGYGAWCATVVVGLGLVEGILDRGHTAIGIGILFVVALDLWQLHGDRVKRPFYWLFGGPDPPREPRTPGRGTEFVEADRDSRTSRRHGGPRAGALCRREHS